MLLSLLLSNWRLIGAGALIIGAFLGGVHVESGHRDAQDAARERATAVAFQAEVKRGKEAAGALLADKAGLQAKADELQRRIRNAKRPTKYVLVPGAPAQAIPGWLVTADDLQLWNSALCAGLTELQGYDSCRAVVPTVSTDVTTGTSITKEDVLSNLLGNAKSCNGDRIQLRALVDLLK